MSRRHFLLGIAGAGLAVGCGSSDTSTAADVAPSPARPGALDTARLEAALDRTFAQLQCPGVLAGCWLGGGEATWASARGFTEREGRTPATFDLHTRVGSVTKTFTGTVILQMVEEGLLRLEDTIERWFPDVPDASRITVRMLGTMSSGINSYTDDPVVVGRYLSNPGGPWTPQELVASGTSLPRRFPPGMGFFYSNTNFVMLGLIAEALARRPIAQIYQERIFGPLGLAQTSYPTGTSLPARYWSGYTLQGDSRSTPLDATHWSPTFAYSAGEIVSDFMDLGKYTRALGRGSLLQPATQALRLIPNPASAADGRAYCFAIGIDHGWLAHDGDVPGYNTQVAYLPALDATLVIMCNSDIPTDNVDPAVRVFQALAPIVSPDNAP